MSKHNVFAVIEALDCRELELLLEMINAYRTRSPFKWPVVRPAAISAVWSHFSRTGVVVDDGRFESIVNSIRDSVLCLKICTILAGHTQLDPSAYYALDEEPESDLCERVFDWIQRDAPSPPISDYGLGPLVNTLTEALCTDTRDMALRLKLIDRMLHFVHQRGDLSALLVEGGRHTVLELESPGVDLEELCGPAAQRPRMRA